MNSAELVTVILTVLFVGLPLSFSGWRYVNVRRSEQRQTRFENYHNLIGWLVEGRDAAKGPMLHAQIAIVFELRNYREYREVSVRILESLEKRWGQSLTRIQDAGEKESRQVLLNEISITLSKLR